MKKLLLVITCVILIVREAASQTIPSISPVFFQYNTPITVTYDVTGTALSSLNDAYIWVWIPGANIDGRYNVNPATSAQAPAKFTKSVDGQGRVTFSITFTPSDFFTQNISGFAQMGMLLKGTDWSNGQTTDNIVSFWSGNFDLRLTAPQTLPVFVVNGQKLMVSATTPVSANYQLSIGGNVVSSVNNALSFSYEHTVTETSGGNYVELNSVDASNSANQKNVSFEYLISGPSQEQARPAGVMPGINYQTDPTKVTLCLWAPGKNSVYAFGDFSDWQVRSEYQMFRDGEYFWVQLDGVTPGEEYAFQYLVNQNIKVADPYSDKILDPNDQFIPEASYPGLKEFPTKALSSQWYYNRLSVFQTNQPSYSWQVASFAKPAKESLVIYELLIRDFFDSENRNYQTLIDTISYFKKLGINAIELMPIMEFNGNEGWGYNPTFMFAPDKYYGTKNKLKEFIDKCHLNGIAVILDIAMNHQDIPNTYAMLDFNFTSFKPTSNNKWFNVDAKHPFNVFFDMNHESAYTKAYLDTVCHYWLNQYKVDGFRFDLSKGFTQKNSGSDVGAWSAYDATRIALIKRMADKIWTHSPDALIILEHLGENGEERELAEYRSGEGKGMMLWGKMTDEYNQNTMGYASNSDFKRVSHTARGWNTPGVVGYMESHDEERLAVKNASFGNSDAISGYSVKDPPISHSRIQTASLMFYTLPGPKMLWQFGELGYDFSINYCESGAAPNSNCRLDPKPVRWDYLEEPSRARLFTYVSDLLRLRQQYSVFTKGTAEFSTASSSLIKQIRIKNNPYTSSPSNENQMNAVIVGNFTLKNDTISVSFPHDGTWYSYYQQGLPVSVEGGSAEVIVPAGQGMLFTDVLIENPIVTDVDENFNSEAVVAYPNPASGKLYMQNLRPESTVAFRTLSGTNVSVAYDGYSWDLSQLASGIYIVEVRSKEKVDRLKIIKN